MIKLKGYIFSRSFFDERVPQHIQNIILIRARSVPAAPAHPRSAAPRLTAAPPRSAPPIQTFESWYSLWGLSLIRDS